MGGGDGDGEGGIGTGPPLLLVTAEIGAPEAEGLLDVGVLGPEPSRHVPTTEPVNYRRRMGRDRQTDPPTGRSVVRQ